ncbi:MAG: peroxidase family protein [Planctomycetota bacterium]
MRSFFGGHERHSALLAPRHRHARSVSLCALAILAAPIAARAQGDLPLFRSVDGVGNNPSQPLWGSAGRAFLRLADAGYADALDAPAGPDRPSPRLLSNALCAQAQLAPNRHGASDFLWQWGQFLDHDLDLAETATPAEPMPIAVPIGDAWFDPSGSGAAVIPLSRSEYEHDAAGVRQQQNRNTAWLDGSQVYGSSLAQLLLLRGDHGLLATGADDLLPRDADGFVAGDVRANEQVGLTAMHTLFVREHNRIATALRQAGFDPDTTLLLARVAVGAELQAITYREFLPVLLGRDALPPYAGFRADVDPTIANEFATAAFRLGHSLLSPTLLRLDAQGREIAAGHLPLRAAFFAPQEILAHGIDPLLRGLARQRAQEIDLMIVDDVRNFLFGAPGLGGFDLASLNVQRGRDHGLPSYVEARRAMGLSVPRRFRDLPCSFETRQALQSAYASVRDIDLWIGGLAEQHAPGAMVGPLFRAILVDQFTRLRDGDPHWYQRVLPPELVAWIDSLTLATIIRLNTGIGDELPDDVFVVDQGHGRP